jgi:hypothetical protein
MPVSIKPIRRLAGFELNALHASEIFGKHFEKVRVPGTGTPIYDINGTILFYRLALKRRRASAGYADIAATEALAEPLLSVAIGSWHEKTILAQAAAIARKRYPSIKFNTIRFVTYSYPKLALQYLRKGKEVLMLAWPTWVPVPQLSATRQPMKPSNFERWSLIDEMSDEIKQSRLAHFKKRKTAWEDPTLSSIDPVIIKKETFGPSKIFIKRKETHELHYASIMDNHHSCHERHGQQAEFWCVAANVGMLLNFYRYQYNQPRLALEMGLGTCDHPNTLPYGEEHKVVDTIKKLSSNTLNVTTIATPTWSIFQTEIKANRPLISFIPGHARTVVGYTDHLIHHPGELPFKGLWVYDSPPPTDYAHPKNDGVITKWENFVTQTHQYACTAVLKHI